MSFYTVNFLIATGLALLATMGLLTRQKRKIWPAVCAPILFYVLFYRFELGLLNGMSTAFISYAGAIFSAIAVLFASSCKKNELSHDEPTHSPLAVILLLFLVQSFAVFVYQCIPWAIDSFPLSNVEAVLFTVFAGENEGADEFVFSSFWAKVPLGVVKITLIALLSQILLALILTKKKVGLAFTFFKKKYLIASDNFKVNLLQIAKPVAAFLIVNTVISAFILPGIILSAPFKALFQQPVDSELYRAHYANPDSVEITATQQPKNLLVIFVESMETNFARYTPELIEWQNRSTTFLPGGATVSGTSWTIAGITGKLCGIPLNMPMGINEHLGKLPTYLPHAKCLMDILGTKGYNQVYSQGSSGDFTQKRTFWTIHGNVAVHDIEYYKSIGKIPEDYKVFWGFEDRKLYGLVREELDSLSKLDKPFALYMLTVDTHQPGFVDDSCAVKYKDVEGLLPKSLHCASELLSGFLTWASEQPWFSNTVISVMGDHAMPSLSPKANIPPDEPLYWTNFMLNSSLSSKTKEQAYSSLDMPPTLLEAMGFKLQGRSFGLGRSLFSDSLTLLEIYGKHKLDSLLRERSIQYDYFLMGK